MQELYQLIRLRFQNVLEVTQQHLSYERVRNLKEQQKARCEKQNFVISMMRANSKSIQVNSKNSYYKYSYQIMKIINPEFQHQNASKKIQENFLNDFVGLYKHFFHKYEEIFNFKLKLQNLIRPTNHNLPLDLVKYLVDFSRDYYQQTFLWYMKSLNKMQKSADNYRYDQPQVKDDNNNLLQKLKDDLEQTSEDPKTIITLKRITRNSLTQVVLQRANSKKAQHVQTNLVKDPTKNYDVLDIAGWPSLTTHVKQMSVNTQVLKIRLNDIYRQMKSRNNSIKSTFYNHFKSSPEKNEYKIKQYLQFDDESLNKATHPYKLSLVIQKNGFNYINILYCDSKYYSKPRDKRLEPLKISQRNIPIGENNIPSDYLLASLKIIRFSQNFLPPILTQGTNQANNANNSINIPILEINHRSNLVSSNSVGNQIEDQFDHKKKQPPHLIYHNPESKPHHLIYVNTQSSTPADTKIPKEKSYRKLSEIKRNFRSQQRRQGGILTSPTITLVSVNDPQKKIYDWLQKLRQIKQIQRKKIMGL